MASPGVSLDAMFEFLRERAPSVPAPAASFQADDFRGFAPSALENARWVPTGRRADNNRGSIPSGDSSGDRSNRGARSPARRDRSVRGKHEDIDRGCCRPLDRRLRSGAGRKSLRRGAHASADATAPAIPNDRPAVLSSGIRRPLPRRANRIKRPRQLSSATDTRDNMAMVCMDFNGPNGFRMVDVIDTKRVAADDPDPVPLPLRESASSALTHAYPLFARRCSFIAASLRAFLEYRYGDTVRVSNSAAFEEAIERYVWMHSGVIRSLRAGLARTLLEQRDRVLLKPIVKDAEEYQGL
jgi:hypothetical protein